MPRFLAIDADAHGLFVAAATLRGGGAVAVERALALADDTAPLNPANAAALGARLKELLKQSGVKPAPVLLCLGRDRVILKQVTHPPTPPAEEPAVVRFQAVRELTENPDDVVMDYTPVGAPTAGERNALVVFVRKQVLQAARDFCDAAGLKLAGLTPRPFAAAAAIRHAFVTGAAPAPEDPAAPVAVVTLWDRGGEFTVARGPEVVFTRTVPAHALAGEQTLTAELKRNLAVYAGQNPAPVEAVYLAEPDDPGGGWSGRVRAALPVPVYAFDPLAGSPADPVPAPLRGRFAGPVGLLAARAAAELPINFVTPRQPRAEAGPARTRVLLGVLAGLLVLALGGGFAYMQIDKADREVADLSLRRNQLDSELKSLDLNAKRLSAADEFTEHEVNVADQLYDVSDMVSDVSKATVTEFDLSAIVQQQKKVATGQPQPANPKDAKPTPVAQLRVVMRSGDTQIAQRVADDLKNDKYYIDVTKTSAGTSSATDPASRGQQSTLIAKVLRRKPGEYTRQLHAAPPRPADGGDFFGGFDGGFAP